MADKLNQYVGCSDVSEFEHIYGQILMTPSCVYGRLFTWTRMVDLNALIVWKTFIDICFSIKSSLWALTAAYTKFRRIIVSMRWSCGHRSRFQMCNCYLIVTPGDFTGVKLKAYNFVISGWVKPLQVGLLKRNSGYDSHDATSPSSFPILLTTSAPNSHLLIRVWGYHDGKILELTMFVGTF